MCVCVCVRVRARMCLTMFLQTCAVDRMKEGASTQMAHIHAHTHTPACMQRGGRVVVSMYAYRLVKRAHKATPRTTPGASLPPGVMGFLLRKVLESSGASSRASSRESPREKVVSRVRLRSASSRVSSREPPRELLFRRYQRTKLVTFLSASSLVL